MTRKKKTMAKRKRKMSRIKVRMMEMGESRRTTRNIVVAVVVVCFGPFMCWVARNEEFGCCCSCSVLAKQWP